MKELSEMPFADLEEYVFPGTDAAVLIIPERIPQAELENMFGGLVGEHRFYPTETGWTIRFPYWYVLEFFGGNEAEMNAGNFTREEKGWDHEHCSFCQARIMVGDLCYTTDQGEGGCYIVCNECATKCKKR
jgi:hypothetical protein